MGQVFGQTVSLVTRGLGGNALVTEGLGDVWRRILWVMRTESREPALVGASSRLNVAAVSRAAAMATSFGGTGSGAGVRLRGLLTRFRWNRIWIR